MHELIIEPLRKKQAAALQRDQLAAAEKAKKEAIDRGIDEEMLPPGSKKPALDNSDPTSTLSPTVDGDDVGDLLERSKLDMQSVRW